MNGKHGILFVALGLGLAAAAAAETIVIAEPEVRTIVTRAGYAEPLVIQRDDALWRVRSLDSAGKEVTLFVDERGNVLGAADVARNRLVTTTTTTTTARVAAPLDAGSVTTLLADAGFHDIHDISLKGGVWKAEADDISGDDLEIHVDATSGRIVHVEDD